MKLLRLLALLVIGFSIGAFAQCATFPCVVASATLTNQTAAIPSTPIFTPTSDGIFRVSAYLSASASTSKSAYTYVLVGWTDENGPRKTGSQAYQNNSNAEFTNFTLRDLAGQPLLYQTLYVPSKGTGMTYNLYITVEQLQ